MRKETRLEEILKILDLKRKLEDKMFYKKKEKDLISIFILLLLLCTRYEIKKRQKEREKITGNL